MPRSELGGRAAALLFKLLRPRAERRFGRQRAMAAKWRSSVKAGDKRAALALGLPSSAPAVKRTKLGQAQAKQDGTSRSPSPAAGEPPQHPFKNLP
jgi:hypothetical protein